MNKFLSIAALATVSLMPTAAMAAPLAWLVPTPNGGAVYFRNDTGAALPNASLISQSGLLKDAFSLLAIPGTIKDDSEFPFAYTYLNLPVGDHFTGYTVKPGTPLVDLTFQYRIGSITSPLISQSLDIPEPSSCLLAATATLAFTAAFRRARSQGN
ncbi:MAG: hypothetical protein C0485_11420 [Pirellula sp.]|nr:hypothetical protein [Pirellula sp.]